MRTPPATASKNRLKALALVALVLSAAALFACDEVYADPVTVPFTSSSSSGFIDAGVSTSPRIPPIPCNSRSNENGPCARVGAVCEYGKKGEEPSPDPTCNQLLQCVSSQFGALWTEQSRGSCVKCPADLTTIVDGAPCDLGPDAGGDEAEVQCMVPGLGNCGCTTGPDGAHVHPRRWVCVKPPADCPKERPLLGQPCFGDHSCDYGACEFKRGAQMICQDEVWQVEVATCK